MLCFEQFGIGPAEYFCCSLKCEQIEHVQKRKCNIKKKVYSFMDKLYSHLCVLLPLVIMGYIDFKL